MEYKWKAFSVTSIGALMSAVDSTIVLLALLPMAQELNSDYVTMIWVIIAYLLANTALVLSLGRMGDMYGRKKMYNIGFVVFTIGSALSGLAADGIMLVGFRVIQGVGAALLTANSFAILSEAFPKNETGKAFGSNSIVWGIGAVLGIVLGGIIISFTTWRLIFLINVPIGIFGTVWAYKTLKEESRGNASEKEKQSFDIIAAILFTSGLLSLLLGVTWGLLYSWGDYITYLAFALSPVLLGLFALQETRYSKDPILNFELFKNTPFTFSLATALIQSLALFSVNFLLIFYLEGIAGLSVLYASYLVLPMAVVSAIVGPFAGLLTDRVGARIIATLGLLVQIGVLVVLSELGTSTPLSYVAIVEAFYGVGGGLFWPANTSAIMSSTQLGKHGVGSGIMNTFRNTGMILSFAISLIAATSAIPAYLVYKLFVGSLEGKLLPQYATGYLSGQRIAFELSALLLVVAVIFSVIKSGKMERRRTSAIKDWWRSVACWSSGTAQLPLSVLGCCGAKTRTEEAEPNLEGTTYEHISEISKDNADRGAYDSRQN
ncbi:MAG: MFS transporter [Nitrososphaerota archaeon]|nr:MFS transporter [Nitrososphaerota archaeon]